METADKAIHLLITAIALLISFASAIASIATDGWSSRIDVPLLAIYNQASDKGAALWVVGCVVLVILGVICLSIASLVLMARFFRHGHGRAALGGVLSIFAGLVFVVCLIIFMVQEPPYLVYYGYSFALLWIAVPFAWLGGAFFFMLQDTDFLK